MGKGVVNGDGGGLASVVAERGRTSVCDDYPDKDGTEREQSCLVGLTRTI